MTGILLSIGIGLAVAFANGGNDQFKGVATLYGSGTTTFRTALLWATVTAAIGCAGALYLGSGLIAAFSGKGLVPDSVVAMHEFVLAVGLGAAATVALATKLKLPVSTTHALIGGLVGTGLFASPTGVNLHQLTGTFVIPLLLSPILSGALVYALYPLAHRLRLATGISRDTCVCIGGELVPIAIASAAGTAAATAMSTTRVTVGTEAACVEVYQGRFLGIRAGRSIDFLHFISAGAVCLSRALNDAPKMVPLVLAGGALSPGAGLAAVGTAMLGGGLLQSRRIAETLGEKTTKMNPGQGLVANLVTSAIVLSSSKLGLPVSTTHVACGSLFGLGAANQGLQRDAVKKIVLAWVVTLPLGALMSLVAFLVFRRFPA